MGTESFVQLPSDTSNAGKKIRYVTKTIGGVTLVGQNVYAMDRKATVLGVYSLSLGSPFSVQASATNGTSTAFFWWTLPNTVSSKSARLRSVLLKINISAVTPTMPTFPRISLGKFTFTGNLSGTQITGIPLQTSYAADVTYASAAITGATPTLVNAGLGLGTALVPPFLLSGTAATIQWPINSEQNLIPQGPDNEDIWPLFVPGEGAVLWQPDAATTTDIRRFTVDLIYDVIDTSGA